MEPTHIAFFEPDTFHDVSYWPEYTASHVAIPLDDVFQLAARIVRTCADHTTKTGGIPLDVIDIVADHIRGVPVPPL
jgi:hypothetical protein